MIEQVEHAAIEQTCRDCRASDQNKDVAFQDPYFRRIWKAAHLKVAGVPVMDLATTLDDVLAIHTVESEMKRIAQDQAEAQARNDHDDGGEYEDE